jgi:ribulose bisphosphate carboxylase small subunit
MQMQKTRLAATTTKTAITQKQSVEMVQTLLHGGVSSPLPGIMASG